MSRKVTPFKSLSPLKGRRRDSKIAYEEAGRNLEAMKSDFINLPTSNLMEGYKDYTQDLTNLSKNLTVDTTSTDRLTDLSNRQLGSTLDIMQQSGAITGGSMQRLYQQQQDQQSNIMADLSRQVKQNQMMELQGEQNLQQQQMQGKMQQQDMILKGKQDQRNLQYQKSQGLMALEAGTRDAAFAREQSYRSMIAKFFSDRRLKENISLVGQSTSGINIYTFEYINKSFGEGKYQGVMSDEIPRDAVIKTSKGYDMVDYSKLDVEFIKI